MKKIPEAHVVAYYPPTRHRPAATVEVECPHCRQRDRWRRPTEIPSRHIHGIGPAGSTADLGDRVAHCGPGWPHGQGYVLTDPAGLVPAFLAVEAVTA